eukprot:6777790-Prymnesium_polylepis.2
MPMRKPTVRLRATARVHVWAWRAAWAARAHREPLALYGHPAGRERLEQQVGDRLVEQVDVVDVEDAAVRTRKQPCARAARGQRASALPRRGGFG